MNVQRFLATVQLKLLIDGSVILGTVSGWFILVALALWFPMGLELRRERRARQRA